MMAALVPWLFLLALFVAVFIGAVSLAVLLVGGGRG